jgi:hypothetical protein
VHAVMSQMYRNHQFMPNSLEINENPRENPRMKRIMRMIDDFDKCKVMASDYRTRRAELQAEMDTLKEVEEEKHHKQVRIIPNIAMPLFQDAIQLFPKRLIRRSPRCEQTQSRRPKH